VRSSFSVPVGRQWAEAFEPATDAETGPERTVAAKIKRDEIFMIGAVVEGGE
jgi:hypothetical protein